jgi:hypothetical protein
MARVFLMKDGWHGIVGKSRNKTVSQLSDELRNHRCRLVSVGPPYFGREPSYYYTRVVVEVTDYDTTDDKFNRHGFYLVEDLEPDQAGFLFD